MEKKVLIKKIKRYFRDDKKLWKKYYKNYKCLADTLIQIADPKHLKPAKQKKVRKYQTELLDFCFNWFDKIDSLGLDYFFIGGNLLGAYRANKLIPWDDDIDIGMMREDYDKLLAYLKENLIEIDTSEIYNSKKNKWVVIHEYLKNNPNVPAFVQYPTNLQIVVGNSDIANLKFLDIHPYDYYKDEFLPAQMKDYLQEIKQQHFSLDNFKEVLNFLNNERNNNQNIVKESNKIYCGIDHWDAIYFPFNEWLLKEDVYPIRKVKFENRLIKVPNNIKAFLKITYGDSYDEMPKSFKILEHQKYREKIIAKNSKDVNANINQNNEKEQSAQKSWIMRKIKRRFFFKEEEKYKSLYKKIQPNADFLLQILESSTLRPTKDPILRDMQLRIADFAKEISDFLTSHDLNYFLNGGSLIGALRHKGFVPWDDDFDFGLMREDYEKLKEILPKYFKCIDISGITLKKSNKNQVVHEALKKSNGEILYFIGPKYIQIFKGETLADCVLVDIFPHDYYRQDYTIKEHIDYLKEITKKSKKLDSYNKIIAFLQKEIKTGRNIVKKSTKIHYAIDNFGSYTTNHYKFMNYDMIFPLKKAKFENYEFNIPNNADEYIKVQYPNYMEIPKNLKIAPDLKIRQKFKF